MDSKDRQDFVRAQVDRVARDTSVFEEVVEAIARRWQTDVQDVHESSYAEGAEGELA